MGGELQGGLCRQKEGACSTACKSATRLPWFRPWIISSVVIVITRIVIPVIKTPLSLSNRDGVDGGIKSLVFHLKDGRYAPHVDEAGAEVLAGGEEEGEEGNPKAERKEEELSKKLLFSKHRNSHHSMSM